MKRTHCKCTHCNGTGQEEEFDNSLLEEREDENTFWSDTLLFALIFGGAIFLYTKYTKKENLIMDILNQFMFTLLKNKKMEHQIFIVDLTKGIIGERILKWRKDNEKI